MSQEDSKTQTIGGETFCVSMLDPRTSRRLFVDVGKVLGPPLAALAASVLNSKDSKQALSQLMDGVSDPGNDSATDGDGSKAVQDLLGGGVEGAISSFIDRVSNDKLDEIEDILMEVTTVKKGNEWPALKSIQVVLFRGRVKLLFQWLGFALRTQYRDFF